MTYHDGLTSRVAAGAPTTTAPTKRPATLSAAVWGAVLTSLLTFAGALVMITAGKDSIREFVAVTAGPDLAGALEEAAAAVIDEAYQTLLVKAGVAIAFALLVLLFAVLARSGRTGVRVGLAIALVLCLCASTGLQLAESDVLPGFSVLVVSVTPLIALVTVVLLFLPPSNRYAAARRRAR
jgi:hypothetical protein